MLAKLTSKNQLTLPKTIMAVVEPSEYFEVTAEYGKIILSPVRINQADAVREKLKELGISSDDVSDAIAWARKPK